MDRRAFLALLLPGAAAAQDASQPAPVHLSKLLESTYWAPGTAKTLLVIGGKETNPLPESVGSQRRADSYKSYYNQQRARTLAQLGPMPPRGYALAAVAACYGQKVTRFGGITALVPAYRKTLNLTPGPPLPPLPLREGSVEPLIDALDDGGIRKLLSESGLGRSDVPRQLQRLFDAVQPGALWLKRGGQEQAFLALPAERLSALRLRVFLVSQLRAYRDNDSVETLIENGKVVLPDRSSTPRELDRVRPPDTGPEAPPPSPRESLLIRSVSSQPLPTDLAPESLTQRISLEGVQYFDELVERVGKTEGLTLVLPQELERWSVEWRGDPNVRTGDVVRAITASVTGTFRECEGSYVLTESLTPLGPRLEKLNRWLEKGDALHKPKPLPVEWGRFDADDLYPIPRALQERLLESDFLRLPLSEFPDKKLLAGVLAPYRASNPNFTPSHVELRMHWQVELLVPGVGPVSIQALSTEHRKRSVRRPLTLRDTWPILKIADPEEAKDVVAWAKQQGALGVVIDGPLETIQAGIAERSLPIRALHRLWQAFPEDPADLKERTVEKVIVDCLSPTDPGAQELAITRLKRVTGLPGLSGVLVRDAAPPGYRSYYGADALTLLGYTEGNRKNFLREYQQDIFDLAPGDFPHDIRDRTLWLSLDKEMEWHIGRVLQLIPALNRLRQTVPANCPVWLEGGLGITESLTEALGSPLPGWLVPWIVEKEDPEHWLWDIYYPNSDQLIDAARKAGKDPWLLFPVPKHSSRASVEERLGLLEQEAGGGWQGRYIDLSEHSFEEAKELL